MTDFETHPVGTAALLAELQAAQKYRYIGKDGKPVLARDLEDRIEQLEAELTRANAAAAAAYEVAAEACADYPRVAPDEAEWTRYDEQIEHSQRCIRALATPDQTAALDRLIAEAVKPYVEALQQIADQTDGVTPEPDNLQMAIGSINSFTRAILAASKKGWCNYGQSRRKRFLFHHQAVHQQTS